MALQVEDIYDILEIKYNNVNNINNYLEFLLMMDQSSDHGYLREGALNVNDMSDRFGGMQERLQKTKIRDTGTYPGICLSIGNEESMVFHVNKDGPFYL